MGGDSVSLFTPLILAGGLGTRLKSVVQDTPKPLAAVQGRPFITFILDQLANAGFREAIILTGFKGEQFELVLGENYRGINLRYSQEPTALGTAGAIKYATNTARTPYLLVLNGDSLIDVELRSIVDVHLANQAQATLVLTTTDVSDRYGSVAFDDDLTINAFQEKTSAWHTPWINAGIYALNTELLDSLPASTQLSLEKDVFPGWLSDRKLRAHLMPARTFIDIGIPSSYLEAQQMAVFSGDQKL